MRNCVNVDSVSWLLYDIYHLSICDKKPMTIHTLKMTELFRYIRYLETKNVVLHKGEVIPNKKSILRCMEFNHFNKKYVIKLQDYLSGSLADNEPDLFDNEWRKNNPGYIPEYERAGYQGAYRPFYCQENEDDDMPEVDEHADHIRKIIQGRE
jgi:hypothetical protein